MQTVMNIDPDIMKMLDDLPKTSNEVQTKSKGTVEITENQARYEEMPEVVISGDDVSACEAAERLGEVFKDRQILFFKGGTVSEVTTDIKGNPIIERVRPERVVTLLEKGARLKKRSVSSKGDIKTKICRCSMQDAKVFVAADDFLRQLPKIQNVVNCPVLVRSRGGNLKVVSGYDKEHQILASKSHVEEVPVKDAVILIEEAVQDYRFAEKGDKSRAIAGFITPALVMGGLLGGRAPMDLGEADKSQSGKGYRAKCVAALYKNIISTVTEKSGGVGSLRESFDSVLYRGATFISLDNIKGKVDVPALESFLTEDIYNARPPHMESVEIDPSRVYVMMTSNKANLTEDLANRACCVRILKQLDGYKFKTYPEGAILDHIRANQPLYLGAVFSVIQEWDRLGCQQTSEAGHSFRKWAQVLDWIVQNIFGEVPLLEGHREAQLRMYNPEINWLRDIAIAVKKQVRTCENLAAHQLHNIMLNGNVEVPKGDDEGTVLREIGKKLARCFKDGEVIDLGDMTAERIVTMQVSPNQGSGSSPLKEYVFKIK